MVTPLDQQELAVRCRPVNSTFSRGDLLVSVLTFRGGRERAVFEMGRKICVFTLKGVSVGLQNTVVYQLMLILLSSIEML